MGIHYSDSVRSAVLDRYKCGEPVTSIAASTNISRSTIYMWINHSVAETRQIEISQYSYRLLEKKAARLEKIIEVITKAKCSPGAPLKVKLSALESLHGQYSVHLLCDALNVPRGTYYNHIYDNSVIESFFSNLKREELYRKKYRSEKEFRTALDDYMDFYNADRPHAHNKYRTSQQAERDHYSEHAY